jgi:hypothetical protein
MTRFMKFWAAGLTAAALAIPVASAAELPDLVGSWKLTGEMQASIHLGEANAHHPEYEIPSVKAPADAWSVVIDEQKGRAFHGHALSPEGKQEPIVGVLSHNSEQLLISGLNAGLYGEIVGDEIEFCFMDHAPDRAGVACWMTAKE